MATPAETTPTTTTPQDDGFDVLEFWIRHRSRILLYGALLILAVIIFGFSQFMKQRTAAAAEAALSSAKNTEGYRKVIQDFPKQPAAASAQLLLAADLRKEGKLDESTAILRSFIEKNPQHSLIAGANLSQAANQEAAGKLDDALSTYKQITATWAGSYAAAAAYVGQARVLQQQGKGDEAKRLYETVITQFPESPFLSEAFRESQKLKK